MYTVGPSETGIALQREHKIKQDQQATKCPKTTQDNTKRKKRTWKSTVLPNSHSPKTRKVKT